MEFPERVTIHSGIIRVVPQYSDTDQSGVVHHSVYPIWFEMGRTELLRANGLAYKDLEKAGVYFVVAELRVRYRAPSFYDEPLELKTECSNVTAAKIEHKYTLTRKADGALLAQGSSLLACVDANGKIRRIPGFMYPQE